MESTMILVLATYAGQAALGLVLGAVLRGFFDIYKRSYLRLWAHGWLAMSLYCVMSGALLYVSQSQAVPQWARAALAATTSLIFYVFVADLAFGAYSLVRDRDVSAGTQALVMTAFLPIAVVTSFVQADAKADPAIAIALQLGVRSLVAGLPFIGVGRWLLGVRTDGALLGRRSLGGAYIAYGLSQLYYAWVATVALRNGTVPSYVFYVGFVELMLLAVIGLGMVVWLLDEDRERIIAASTEAARAKEALREREAQLRAIIDNSPAFIFAKDLDGRYLFINRPFLEMWRFEEGNVIGKTDADLFPEYLVRVFREDDAEVLSRNGLLETEIEYPVAGIPRLFLSSKFPLRDETGRPYGVCGITTDLTERKRLEDHLRQAQKLESIGRLAGGVAHDFNNLLTAILGHVELGQKALEAGHPLHADLAEVHRAGMRAANLTRQLLAFARQQMIEPRLVDLNGLLSGMDALLRRLAGETVTIRTELAPRLWAVRADPGQLEQVAMNLVVNARDAMPNGGTLTIRTTHARVRPDEPAADGSVPAGDYVLLEVADSGVGMSESVRSRIFEPFFTTKEKGRGTGLGLATSYGIVKQSGGYISASSREGEGTMFRIYLPRVEGEPVAADERAVPAGALVARPGETILVVEDEPAVRAVAVRTLRNAGYAVLEAIDGEHGLEVASAHPGKIDMVLTDVVMPRLGGRELIEQLKPIRPKLRTLFTSGYTDDAFIRDGLLDEDILLLHKPFAPVVLLTRVRQILDAPPA
jgi:PAS domain S-box-containing protein